MKTPNLLTALAAAVCLCATFTACNPEPEDTSTHVSEVKLDKPTLSLLVGDEATLVATVLPEDATNKEVEWESDKPGVATVVDGLVTAIGTGEATITATSVDGKIPAQCVVTVQAGSHATGVTLDQSALALVVGDEATLVATVLPTDAINKEVEWKSDKPGVATVVDGLVTAIGTGEATITATSVDGNHPATCNVTVAPRIPVEDLRINRAAVVLKESETVTIIPFFIPENATNQKVTFNSTDPTVATVNAEGLVTAIAEGSAMIEVTTDEITVELGAITKICHVTVSNSTTMRCSTDTPGWGESLGEVGFATDQTWTIGGLVWSDAVTASACDKDTFEGGNAADIFKADGRSIPDISSMGTTISFKGNFFSWCAVALYRETLCPDGWRVPGSADFVALDIAFGGTGVNKNYNPNNAPIRDKYETEWGGEYTGWATNTGNSVYSSGSESHYWAIDEKDENTGYELSFRKNGFVGPLNGASKAIGGALRCVKDAE